MPQAGRTSRRRESPSSRASSRHPARALSREQQVGDSLGRRDGLTSAGCPSSARSRSCSGFGFEGTDASADIVDRLRRLGARRGGDRPGNYADEAPARGPDRGACATTRGGLPPFVLTSQEGGELNSLPGLPPSSLAGRHRLRCEAGAEALASGRALRGLGVTGVLGPEVDVGLESDSALGERVYSDDPEEVAAYARRTVEAYRTTRVFSSAAHLPGLGGADQSTQDGPATVGLELEQLRERDLIPFEAAIAAGVPGVTLAHALYPFSDFTVPASLSPAVATRLLRDELGFEGIALTDDLADPAITTLYTVPDAAVEAVAPART